MYGMNNAAGYRLAGKAKGAHGSSPAVFHTSDFTRFDSVGFTGVLSRLLSEVYDERTVGIVHGVGMRKHAIMHGSNEGLATRLRGGARTARATRGRRLDGRERALAICGGGG